MPDPAAAAATQLRNIEQATGRSMADFAHLVAERGIDGHAKIVAFLKAEHGLSHGNANAVALKVRELAAGGPSPADALLDAQYTGPKAALRLIYGASPRPRPPSDRTWRSWARRPASRSAAASSSRWCRRHHRSASPWA